MSLVRIFHPCLLLSSSTGYQIFKHGFQISKHVRAYRHVKIGPSISEWKCVIIMKSMSICPCLQPVFSVQAVSRSFPGCMADVTLTLMDFQTVPFTEKCVSQKQHCYLLRPPSAVGERSIVMSVSVCLCVFVCPRSYLRNYTSDLHQIFVHVTYGRGSVLGCHLSVNKIKRWQLRRTYFFNHYNVFVLINLHSPSKSNTK